MEQQSTNEQASTEQENASDEFAPDSAATSETEQPTTDSPDAVLASAAATAQPGQQPKVDPQAPGLEAQTEQPGQDVAATPLQVFSLEQARALPEIDGPAYVPAQADDPRAILAFADTDGRTMAVAATVDGLAKIAVPR